MFLLYGEELRRDGAAPWKYNSALESKTIAQKSSSSLRE
ncbi:hypothetical protein [Azospirillum argentinense]|uniref:Uncharacterized protein n=1 Tax=Azospirillum argentinense TaxID=2970906 RepID=A0A5B0KL01_9PROT|nr:hypothetical protein FH063_004286 [Azospirillum argentinense]